MGTRLLKRGSAIVGLSDTVYKCVFFMIMVCMVEFMLQEIILELTGRDDASNMVNQFPR